MRRDHFTEVYFMNKISGYLYKAAGETKKLRSIIGAALLIALSLVLDRFFTIIVTPTIHINFSFITKAITGALYGPVVALYAGALNDVVAYVAYPKGAFFIGFTISAAITGMIYGLFLYKVRLRWWRAIAAQGVVTVVVNLFLNTIWLSILYDKAAIPLFAARLVKNLAMLPLEAALVMIVTAAVVKAFSRRIRD
jgi:ECF transporter S component (folate family)